MNEAFDDCCDFCQSERLESYFSHLHPVLVITIFFLFDGSTEKLLCLLSCVVQETVLLQVIASGHGLLLVARVRDVAQDGGGGTHRVSVGVVEQRESPGSDDLCILKVLSVSNHVTTGLDEGGGINSRNLEIFPILAKRLVQA